MSEQLVKHSRKAFKILGNHEGGLRKKFAEFLTEIAIIVFAISLSLFIEHWQAKRVERQQTEEILKGLKDDLASDIKELHADSAGYQGKRKGLEYFLALEKPINIDSFKRNYGRIMQTIGLIPNISRFESLKVFGKVSSIKSKQLVNDIFDLYEEKIPGLVNSTTVYNQQIESKMAGFIDEHLQYTKDLFDVEQNNLIDLMHEDVFRNLLRKTGYVNEIIARYGTVIDLTKKLIGEIDDELQ